MTHTELQLQIDALIDGELTPEDAREVEAHLEACSDCTRLHRDRVALATAIKQQVPAWTAPVELRTRVRAGLVRASQKAVPRRTALSSGWTWLGLAASLAVVALGSWQVASDRAAAAGIRDQVLAGHLRSLLPGHLTDVASSDQHTVKPWFDGKLDFAPPVVDLAGSGYPLIGGRLEYVAGHPAAGLVYKRRQHVINLFVWPDASRVPLSRAAVRGFNLYHWTAGGMTFWAASDVNEQELAAFARLISPGV